MYKAMIPLPPLRWSCPKLDFMKTKVKAFIKKALSFLLNPRLLLCWGIAWLITNGWSYVVLALGTYLDITWMKALGGGYVTFLWLPISPEKLVTAAIAMVLLRLLFPNDQKTLAVIKDVYEKAKRKLFRKRQEKDQAKENTNP